LIEKNKGEVFLSSSLIADGFGNILDDGMTVNIDLVSGQNVYSSRQTRTQNGRFGLHIGCEAFQHPDIAMRRRYLFPAILVGASVIWSGFAGLANSPAKQYEYLNALVVDDRYAFGTAWIKTDVPNIEKLSEIDEVLLVQLLESFDNPVHEPTGRKLFLDQAEADFQTRQCDSSKKRCELRFHLNRKIEPSYVHGDLRLIQARISSIVQEVSLSEECSQIGDGSYGPPR